MSSSEHQIKPPKDDRTPSLEIPPLIKEACKYCLCKIHPNPFARCRAYGGVLPNMWLSENNVPFKCLGFTRKEMMKSAT